MEKILAEKGSWFYIVPIKNVILTDAVNNEFVIDRVRLVDINKLPRIRKKIGFPYKLSEFKKKYPDQYERFFKPYQTFATLRQSGTGAKTREEFLSIVREELAILSLSQLGLSRRQSSACPAMAEEVVSGLLCFFMINSLTKHWILNSERTGKKYEIVIRKNWVINQKNSFFFDLLKILRGEIKISDSWSQDLKNAAILAGQSQSSIDLPQCFLWNMIAIELLLTKPGDSYSNKLPERAEALLEWMEFSRKRENFQKIIRDLYLKRCALVHTGKRNVIEISDLLLSDTILLNLLINIVKHPKLFRSKEMLLNFSEKIQAEYVLGLKPKVRPKSFRYLIPIYGKQDYEKI